MNANGGDGWVAAASAQAHGGDFEVATSYAQCTRSQTIDLIAAGFSAAELDAGPDVVVSEWFREYYAGADPYQVRVELRDGSAAVLDSWTPSGATTGVADYGDDAWFELSHTFSSYGSGLRYIYFEDGGRDAETWGGHYGVRMDDAYVGLVR